MHAANGTDAHPTRPAPTAGLLLLRGLAREKRHWRGFPQRLENALPGVQILTLDLPGAGTEHARPSPTTIAGITEDIRVRWLKAKSEPGAPPSHAPWGIMAMSLGGMIGLDWLNRHPSDFAGAILCSTSAGGLSPPWQRMKLSVVPRVLGAFTQTDPVARERTILSFTTSARTPAELDQVAAEWARHPSDQPMSRQVVINQLRAGLTFRAPLSVAPPVLFLAGERDQMMAADATRALAAALRAPVHVHPTAGHELALDAPDWLAEQMANWFRVRFHIEAYSDSLAGLPQHAPSPQET
jgi:alpha-beta hydrolase superfamily lysophospholipase